MFFAIGGPSGWREGVPPSPRGSSHPLMRFSHRPINSSAAEAKSADKGDLPLGALTSFAVNFSASFLNSASQSVTAAVSGIPHTMVQSAGVPARPGVFHQTVVKLTRTHSTRAEGNALLLAFLRGIPNEKELQSDNCVRFGRSVVAAMHASLRLCASAGSGRRVATSE